MIACLTIPGLELKTALRRTPTLALRPAALAPNPQGEPLIGSVTAAAETAGVQPGMRLGEALATLNRPAEAETALQAAQAGAVTQDLRPLLWRIAIDLGNLYQAQRRDKEAEQAFAEATRLSDAFQQKSYRDQDDQR